MPRNNNDDEDFARWHDYGHNAECRIMPSNGRRPLWVNGSWLALAA